MEYFEYSLEYIDYCDLQFQMASSFKTNGKCNKDKTFGTNFCLDLNEKKANKDDISNARIC